MNKYILVSDNLSYRERERGVTYKLVEPGHRIAYDTEQEAMVAGRKYLQGFNGPHQGVFVCKIVRKVTL